MRPDSYFDHAESWAVDTRASAARAQRNAWAVAGVAVAVAAMEAVALAMLAPLKTIQPITLLVDRQTGFVQALDPASPRRVSADAALTQSLLAQYVAAREGFDRATVAVDYRKVALWSTGRARSSYLTTMPATNPASPFQRYPGGAVVAVRVKSVSRLSQGTALVRFDTQMLERGGQAAPAQPWISVVRFRFSEAPMRFEDRLVNPLGFQVTGYRRDAEAPPPATSANASPTPPLVRANSFTVGAAVPAPTRDVTRASSHDPSATRMAHGRRSGVSDAAIAGSVREVPLNQLPLGSPLEGPR